MRNYYLISLLIVVMMAVACQDEAAVSTLPTRETPAEISTAAATEPPLAPVDNEVVLSPTATLEPSPTLEPTPTETATPLPPQIITPLDDGRIQYFYPGEMFTLALPPSWSVADLAGYQGGEFAAETAAGGDLEELFTSGLFRDLISSGIRFYAVNSSRPSLNSPNPANINILSIPAQGGSLAGLVEENLAQITENFELVDEITQNQLQIDGRPAIQLGYTTIVTNPLGESFQLKTWQYMVEGENGFIVFTGTVVDDLVPTIGPEIEAAAASLRVTNP